jgi:hypothetical protein
VRSQFQCYLLDSVLQHKNVYAVAKVATVKYMLWDIYICLHLLKQRENKHSTVLHSHALFVVGILNSLLTPGLNEVEHNMKNYQARRLYEVWVW